MAKLNCDVSDQNMELLKQIRDVAGDGTFSNALEIILNSITNLNISNQNIPLHQIMSSPTLLLKDLNFESSIKTDFKKNYMALPFDYRQKLYELLYLLTRKIALYDTDLLNPNIACFNKCFISVAKHLCLYYSVPTNSPDSLTGGHLSLYINITGYIGDYPIAIEDNNYGFTNSFRKSNTYPDSPIWVSNYERFVTARFYYPQENPLFHRIINLLGINNAPLAVQLGLDDLQLIIDYIHQEIATHNIPTI